MSNAKFVNIKNLHREIQTLPRNTETPKIMTDNIEHAKAQKVATL